MILSTPHAHTDFVDGKSSAEQMVLSAIERGFQSLGFSEHAVQPFDRDYCLSEQAEAQLIAEVDRLRQKYRDRIHIYLGSERDLYAVPGRNGYRYVIGSVHYMMLDGEYIAVDGPKEQLRRLIREGFQQDGQRFAARYFELLAGYIEDLRPDIVGHFDLIRKHNPDGRLFDTDSKAYRRSAFEALERIAKTGALLELNTGAMARGYLDMPYPEPTTLKFWRELGGRIILSSDCHDAALIDYGYTQALALARHVGYREAWALNPEEGALFVAYGT